MVLQFNHIQLSGFLSIEDAEMDLDNDGFVLINGVNHTAEGTSSNGAGKSSLFDGIVWILTGATIRGTTDVVNSYSSNGAYGKLEFSVNGHDYIIIRSKNHYELGTSLSINIDGEDKSGDGLRKTESLLKDYLPMITSELLGSVIVLGQGLPQKFSSLSPKGRKDLLESLSKSSDFIETLKDRLNRSKSRSNDEYIKLDREYTELTGKLSSRMTMINDMSARMESYNKEELLQSKADLEGKIRGCDQYVLGNQSILDKLKLEHSQLSSSRSQYYGTISILMTQVSLLQSEIKLLQSRVGSCPTCGKPFDESNDNTMIIQSKSSEMTEKLEQSQVVQSKIDQIDLGLKEISTKISQIESTINGARSTKSTNQAIVARIDEKLESTSSLDDQLKKLKISQHDDMSRRDEIEPQKTKIESRITAIDYLARESSKEFRGYLLEDVVKYINEKVQVYSEYLFGNSYIEVKLDGNQIWLGYEGRSYENLSSGERQRLDLAIQFSLRDMMIQTTGFSCNILVLDESFDGLDDVGCSNLINLVTSKFEDLSSIFIITHHADIEIPYDKQITINKEPPGLSRIIRTKG